MTRHCRLLDVEKAGAFVAQVREIRGDALVAKGDAQGARAEYAAALAAESKGQIDRATVELKLRDVGGEVPAATTASAAKGRLLMFAARSCPRRARCVGRTAFLALVGCGDDKEIDPPAELVDIVAKRDVHRDVDRRASAAIPSCCGLRCAPRSSRERVYAASHDGEVVALAADSGKRTCGASRRSWRCPPGLKWTAGWSCSARATARSWRSTRAMAASGGASRSAAKCLRVRSS